MKFINCFFIFLMTLSAIFPDEEFRTAKKGDTWAAWWNDWTWGEKLLGSFRDEPPDKYSEKEKDEMEINKLKTKNSELINENVALQKNQEELEQFIRDNPEKFDLSMSIDQLKQEINTLEEEKSKINNNIESLKSTKQDYIDEENALRKKFSDSKRDYELQQGELQANKEKLEKAKLDLGAEYAAFEKEKEEYNELKEKFATQAGVLSARLDEIEQEWEELEKENREKEEEYNKKKTELNKKIEECNQKYDDRVNQYEEQMGKLDKRTAQYVPVKECKKTMEGFTFFAYDPLPVAGWIASLGISSFYNGSLNALFREHQSFIDINSMNHFDVWVEPFGMYADWGQEDISCDLYAVGATAGFGGTIGEVFSLGIGLGYWHNSIGCEKEKDDFDGQINTFAVGPYFSWVFGKGYFGFMFWGGYNKSRLKRKGLLGDSTQKTRNEHDWWSLAGRAELGYSFELGKIMTNPSFVTPFVSVDFYRDMQSEYTETNGGKNIYDVESRNCDFLSLLAAVKCKKEFHVHGKGFAIPSFSIGWRYLLPLSCDDSKVHCYIPPNSDAGEDADGRREEFSHTIAHQSYISNNLVYADGGFTYIARNGIATAVKLEASVGSRYQIYGAQLRLEIGW